MDLFIFRGSSVVVMRRPGGGLAVSDAALLWAEIKEGLIQFYNKCHGLLFHFHKTLTFFFSF